jgi:deferrochelatase/peroxidase EfeB
MYGDDPRGLKCPVGAHVRRMNARDAVITGEVRLHRMIRRGTNWTLPAARHARGRRRRPRADVRLRRQATQFELVQREWVNDGKFIGAPEEHDPLIGVSDAGTFTVPHRPIRRRMTGLPSFVVNRGDEYCFMPGLRALRWLADLDAYRHPSTLKAKDWTSSRG